MHSEGKHLAPVDLAIGVLQVHRARAKRLDLGAEELDARLVLLVDEVVVPCFFILGNDFGYQYVVDRIVDMLKLER